MNLSAERFGPVQHRIMHLLWERGKLTAREITDALNKSKPMGPLAHSTVQTLLRKLETKGAVAHERHARTFYFYALVEKQRATGSALREVMGRVFGGSPMRLVAHLLQHERLPAEELEEIKRLIEAKGRKDS
jgi:BlaI family transcriptional regulator, penicillinase repressor